MPDAENIFIQQASNGITSHSTACRPHENTEDTSNEGVDSSSTAPTIFFKDVRLVTNKLRDFCRDLMFDRLRKCFLLSADGVEAAQQIGCSPDRWIVFNRYFTDLIKGDLRVGWAVDYGCMCTERDIFRKIRDFRNEPFSAVEFHFFPGEHVSGTGFADGDTESGPFQQDRQQFCGTFGFFSAEDSEGDLLEEVHFFPGLGRKE